MHLPPSFFFLFSFLDSLCCYAAVMWLVCELNLKSQVIWREGEPEIQSYLSLFWYKYPLGPCFSECGLWVSSLGKPKAQTAWIRIWIWTRSPGDLCARWTWWYDSLCPCVPATVPKHIGSHLWRRTHTTLD